MPWVEHSDYDALDSYNSELIADAVVSKSERDVAVTKLAEARGRVAELESLLNEAREWLRDTSAFFGGENDREFFERVDLVLSEGSRPQALDTEVRNANDD